MLGLKRAVFGISRVEKGRSRSYNYWTALHPVFRLLHRLLASPQSRGQVQGLGWIHTCKKPCIFRVLVSFSVKYYAFSELRDLKWESLSVNKPYVQTLGTSRQQKLYAVSLFYLPCETTGCINNRWNIISYQKKSLSMFSKQYGNIS